MKYEVELEKVRAALKLLNEVEPGVLPKEIEAKLGESEVNLRRIVAEIKEAQK